MKSKTPLIVFYDGDCGFCNFWVQWILKKDRRDRFRFARLQGPYGQQFLETRGLPTQDYGTLYLWRAQHAYWQKSDAVLTIAETLGGFFLLTKIFWLLPRFLRDRLYEAVAASRQKIRTPQCLLPTPEERKKFMD